MGTTFRRGNKWGINFIDSHGRQVRKMVSSYKESAERILRKVETEVAEGKYLDIKKQENILFEDFASEYIKTHVRLESKSPKNQEYMIKQMVTRFQGRYLHQIDGLSIRQYMAERLKNYKPASVNREFQILRCMFNRAIDWGKLSKNPAAGIKCLPQSNSRCRWLTVEEQERLLSYCPGLTRVIVLIALQTGMRKNEILTLKWKQSPSSNYVDFDNDVIFIHESLAKSQRSRHIPISNALLQALQEIERIPGQDYIFLNPRTSRPLGSVKKTFQTALRKAGISDFKFHDLRHTFASGLVRNGVDFYVTQKLLGHTTPKMTQRYAHLSKGQLKDAIGKIDMQSTFLAHRLSSELNVKTQVLQEIETK